jgi:uncharacterized protein (DUF983 family)
MKSNAKIIIYIAGVILLGLIYYPLKTELPSWLFVLVAIIYLITLRLVAEYINNKIMKNNEE